MTTPNAGPSTDTSEPGRIAPRWIWPATVVVVLAVTGVLYAYNGGLIAGAGYFFRPFAYAAVAIVIAWVFRLVLDHLTPYDDTAEVVDRNCGPIALQRGALYLALLLGMAGSLSVHSRTFLESLGSFALDGAVMALVLVGSTFVTDLYLLRSIRNYRELQAGNWAVAMVEAGAYIGLGAILNGAFAGAGGGVWSGLEFALIGQITLAGMYLLYEWRTQCDVDCEITDGNVALGIEVAAFLLAIGIVERFSIIGPFTGWLRDIVSYLEALVPGLLAITLVMIMVDVLFLPRVSLRGAQHHGKIAASLIVASAAVGAATIIGIALVAA